MIKSAIISDCGLYRYDLRRIWDESLPPAVFIMLNPSTADADKDDPTIRRCISFAKDERCGSLTVVNIGAFRATSPKDWLAADDPVGPKWREYMRAALEQVYPNGGTLIVAWGNHGAGKSADTLAEIKRLGLTPLCFGVTKSGQPRHPLYIAQGQPLVPFSMTGIQL